MRETANPFRQLPQVEALLAAPDFAPLTAAHGRALVVEAVRADLDALRARLAAGQALAAGSTEVARCAERVQRSLAARTRSGYPRVINATGVVLHTGLGRAPLAEAARAALEEAAGYALLEVEREGGRRGVRDAAVSELLAEIAGAEAATVVNNNAGATLICLAALAAGRPVVVSRGQLVEIGGSYRIPDVMAQSGARLVEVGTTNRTHAADYARALDAHPDAALLLRVHTSNFKVVGFTAEVPLEELVALARARGLEVMDDLGSGCFVDLGRFGLPGEPVVQESVRLGAGLITFSGDKLLGGPQAGLVVGRRELVERVRRHPLYRALRPDKLTLAALEATLGLYRDPQRALAGIPVLRMLTTPLPELDRRARALAAALAGLEVEVVDAGSKVGGGSYATEELPSRAVALRPRGRGAEALAQALRDGDPPVFVRIQDGRLLLDPRTLLPGDEPALVRALRAALLPEAGPPDRA